MPYRWKAGACSEHIHDPVDEKKLQERAVNVTSFLVRYGTRLIPLMDERLELDGSVHQVVEL